MVLLVLGFALAANAEVQKPAIVDGTFQLRQQREVLDAQIRARLSTDPVYAAKVKALGKVQPAMVVHKTTIDFQVYNFGTGSYQTRSGILREVGAHCYIFVEQDSYYLLGSDGPTTLAQIRATFDEKVFPTATGWFGNVFIPPAFGLPDDKIYIYLCDIRDGLSGGYVAGYFDSEDIEAKIGGNRKPVFFMDLNPGKPGNPTDKNNDFYRTLVHEMQHMINFSRHFALGALQEDRWIEEGLSGFAEYAYTSIVTGDGIGLPPSPHLSKFLANPDLVLTNNSSFEWLNDSTTLFRHYGASFLYCYYLQEKYGGSTENDRKVFVQTLINNRDIGVTGLNSALAAKGATFVQSLKNWLLANHLNDTTIGNGFYGYVDKATRLGTEGNGIPIAGSFHTYSANSLSTVGGEGTAYPNAGKYHDISGTGRFTLLFEGETSKFTPFVGLIGNNKSMTVSDVSLSASNTGSIEIDLSSNQRAVIVPALIDIGAPSTAAYFYRFQAKNSKLVLYPVPNPAFFDDDYTLNKSERSFNFLIVVKSTSGALPSAPVVQVSFNNIVSSPAMTAVDPANPTMYVGNYLLPSVSGEGVVTATVGGDTSSFSFFQSSLKSNVGAKLTVKEAEFSVTSRLDTDSAYLFETALVDPPSELKILSKPYNLLFSAKDSVEARLLVDSVAYSVDNDSQIGFWTGRKTGTTWLKASRNERGFFSPITFEGTFALAADTVAPRIHDAHVEEGEDKPTLIARVTDGGSGINRDSIRVEVNSESVPYNFDPETGQITTDLSRLSKGQHRIVIEVKDLADNRGRAILDQTLQGPLMIVQTAAYPNPCRGTAHLAAILDGSGANDASLEVEARIYDVANHKITSLPLNYKSNGTFIANWDTRNEDGKQVANGVYIFKVVVRRSGEELKSTGKLAILR